MNLKRLGIIFRATSGAGKSTLGDYFKLLKPDAVICTTDDFFVNAEGVYNFDFNKLGWAHRSNQEKFENALKDNKELVVCANTNTTEKDLNIYLNLLKKYNYSYIILVIENRNGTVNTHGCPPEIVCKQAEKLKQSLKLL